MSKLAEFTKKVNHRAETIAQSFIKWIAEQDDMDIYTLRNATSYSPEFIVDFWENYGEMAEGDEEICRELVSAKVNAILSQFSKDLDAIMMKHLGTIIY